MSNEGGSSEFGQSTSINRRRVLKTLGVASGATVLTSGFFGNSQAATTNRTNEDLYKITGEQKREVVSMARQTDAFKDLSTDIKDRGYKPMRSGIGAYHARGDDGLSYQIIDFDCKYIGDSESQDAEVAISIALQDGSYHDSVASISTVSEHEKQMDAQLASSDGSTSFTIDVTKIALENRGVSESHDSKTFSMPDEPVEQGGDRITTQGAVCDFCNAVGRKICSVGCSISAGAFCLVLGVSGVAGIACGTM